MLTTAARFVVWEVNGSTQIASYCTLLGRIDQFILGMCFCKLEEAGSFRRFGTWIFAGSFLALSLFWHWLNLKGGFWYLGPYPSPSRVWVVLPTIEGLAWGLFIVGYQNAQFRLPKRIDALLCRIGEVSYSIYLWNWVLLHFVVRFYLPFPTEFAPAFAFALLLFVPMVLFSIVSYEIIERPFLRYRVRYTVMRPTAQELGISLSPQRTA